MNTIKFSPVKRIAAKISMLLGLILSVAIFFMPILRIEEKDTIGDEEFKMVMAISPFQFLTGDTVVMPQVIGGTSEENEFLEMFLKNEDFLKVAWENMSTKEFDETLETIDHIKPFLVLALFLTYVVGLFIKGTAIRIYGKENYKYFEKQYGISDLDMFPIMFILVTSTIVTVFMYYSNMCQAENINHILPIATIIITFLLASGIIRNIIVRDERKAILRNGVRFDNDENKIKTNACDDTSSEHPNT